MLTELTNKTLVSESGVNYEIGKLFAQGGQGVLYKAKYGNKQYVVKLYKSEGVDVLPTLRKLKQLKISADFILPVDVFSAPYTGYAMELVQDHIPLQKLLVPGDNFVEWFNAETGGLRKRLYLGYLIALRFAQLHELNLAYCDLSGTNILVNKNPDLVTVRLIDADNIYVPGSRINSILGTSRYMAPEIMTKLMKPDTFTDDYSLAVLLFELLRCGHPYVGDLVMDATPEEEELAYQGLFPYVDDVEDDSNRSTQMLPAEVVFTAELADLFKRTFVTAKEERILRPRAIEYAIACLEASNKLIKCPCCKQWFYVRQKKDNPKNCVCPWCDASITTPYYLLFTDHIYKIGKKGEKILLGQKNRNTYILREDRNLVSEQYLQTKMSGTTKKQETTQQIPSSLISRDRSLEPTFIFDVRYAEDGHFYMKSPNEEVIIQRRKKQIKVFGSQYERLEKGDTLRFSNKYLGELDIDGTHLVIERVAYLNNGDK